MLKANPSRVIVTPRNEGDETTRPFHPEVPTVRCPDFRFVLRSAFPVSQWLALVPCCVVPGHSSGGCAGLFTSFPASVGASSLFVLRLWPPARALPRYPWHMKGIIIVAVLAGCGGGGGD